MTRMQMDFGKCDSLNVFLILKFSSEIFEILHKYSSTNIVLSNI